MSKMKTYSYCKKHDTYPLDDEPCWACIRQSGGELNPSDSIANENQENRKPCRVDGKTLCYQYPDDDCGCDPCNECEVKLQLKGVEPSGY